VVLQITDAKPAAKVALVKKSTTRPKAKGSKGA
jgi:hypothetical protein